MKRKSAIAALAVAATLAALPAADASATGNGTTVLNNSGKLTATGLDLNGAAAGDRSMSLTLQLPLRNTAELQALVAGGRTISPQQYRDRFAPSAAALDAVRTWARSQGFTVDTTSASGGTVAVRGTVATVNRAFGVQMHEARLHGVRGLAVDRAPSVPASLGLAGVSGLNTLGRMRSDAVAQEHSRRTTMRPQAGRMSPMRGTTSDGSTQCANHWGDHLAPTAKKYAQESNYLCGYAPADLATMYGVKPAAASKPTLGVLLWGGEGDLKSTVNEYMHAANFPALSDYTSVVETPNAHMADCGPYDVQGEQAMDVESSHAIAPNAAIRYYGAASCYDDDLAGELQKMVDAHQVSTISMSFGEAYDDTMTRADQAVWDRPLAQADVTGISTFASSGDDGDNSTKNDLGPNGAPDGKPHVGYPASSSFTTAVGGTSVGLLADGRIPVNAGWEDRFYNQYDPLRGIFTPIDDHPVYGAGGGVSAVSTQPPWQKGKVYGSTTRRAVPDVAAVGDPYTGYTVHYRAYTTDAGGRPTGSQPVFETIGGTSLSSPVVAAIVGLAKAHNHSHLGLATPTLYRLLGTAALTDNDQPDSAGVYFSSAKWGPMVVALDGKPQQLFTRRHWDNVTGVGSPNGMRFINAFK